jgi:hypothetical protein
VAHKASTKAMKKIYNYSKRTAAFIETLLSLKNPSPEELTDAVLRKLHPASPPPGFLGAHSRDEIRLLAILSENELEDLAVARSGKPWKNKDELFAAFNYTDCGDFSRHWRAEQVASEVERLGHNPPLVVDWLESMSTSLGSPDFKAQVEAVAAMGWSKKNIQRVLGKNERKHPVVSFIESVLPYVDSLRRGLEPGHRVQPIAERLLDMMMKTAAAKSHGAFTLQSELPGLFDSNPALDLVAESPKKTPVPPTVTHSHVPTVNGADEYQAPPAETPHKHQAPVVEADGSGSQPAVPKDWPDFLKPPLYLQKKGILRIQFKGQGSGTKDRKRPLIKAGFVHYSTRFAWERPMPRDQVDAMISKLITFF